MSDQAVTIDAGFEVYERENLRYKNRNQLGFKGLLTDSVITAVMSNQSSKIRLLKYFEGDTRGKRGFDTGIKYNGVNGKIRDDEEEYENLLAYVHGEYYRNSEYMYLTLEVPYSSIRNTSMRLQAIKADLEPIRVSADYKNTVTSDQKTLDIKFKTSGNVKEFRIYQSYDAVRNMYTDSYKDVTEPYEVVRDIMTFDATRFGVTSSLHVVGVDDEGMGCFPSYLCGVYRNVPLEGEWESIGEGKVGEYLAHGYAGRYGEGYAEMWGGLPSGMENYQFAGISEQRVNVEQRKDMPGLYRIANLFGDNHPLRDSLEQLRVDKADIFYMVIDARDASRVKLEESMCGLDVLRYEWNGKNVNEYYKDDYWGKNVNGRISFKNGDIDLSWDDLSKIGRDMDCFYLELPGYMDYGMTMAAGRTFDDKVSLSSVSENVASVDLALIEAEDYDPNFPELQSQRVIERDSALIIKNYPVSATGEVTVDIADLCFPDGVQKVEGKEGKRKASVLTSGYYRCVAVPRDKDGKAYIGCVSKNEIKVEVDADYKNWKYLGTAAIEDMATLMVYDFGEGKCFEYTAEMYEHKEKPGIYKLKESHRGLFNQMDPNIGFEYKSNDMIIDARDEMSVNLINSVSDPIFSDNERGYETGMDGGTNVATYINTWANLNTTQGEPVLWEHYGRKYGREIYFDKNSMFASRRDLDHVVLIGYYKVILPEVSGGGDLEAEDAEAGAAEEWYNLQGIRVNADNMLPGLYIRKRGNTTSKVLVK